MTIAKFEIWIYLLWGGMVAIVIANEIVNTVNRYRLLNKYLPKVEEKSPLYKHKDVYQLILAYERLDAEKFRIISIALKSLDRTKNPISSYINIFGGIVVPTFLSLSALLISISTSILVFSNNDLFMENTITWVNVVMDILTSLNSSIDYLGILFFIFASFSIALVVGISLNIYRENITKKHITVIEEIEKRRESSLQK